MTCLFANTHNSVEKFPFYCVILLLIKKKYFPARLSFNCVSVQIPQMCLALKLLSLLYSELEIDIFSHPQHFLSSPFTALYCVISHFSYLISFRLLNRRTHNGIRRQMDITLDGCENFFNSFNSIQFIDWIDKPRNYCYFHNIISQREREWKIIFFLRSTETRWLLYIFLSFLSLQIAAHTHCNG